MASIRGVYADEYQKFHPEQWVNIYQITYYGDRLVFYCEGQTGQIPEMLTMEELEEFFLEPTNYQYWNWGVMLHVSYQPTPEADRKIRAALGLSPKSR